MARIYPPRLVTAILKAVKKQMELDGEYRNVNYVDVGPNPEAVGPSPEEYVELEEYEGDYYPNVANKIVGSESGSSEEQIYYDDITGVQLSTEGVLAARKEELDWLKKAEVYEKRTIEECWNETGKAPITLKRIDRNKGDSLKPNYRSRIVVREVKKQHGALPGHMLFSNMPPLEAALLRACYEEDKQEREPATLGVVWYLTSPFLRKGTKEDLRDSSSGRRWTRKVRHLVEDYVRDTGRIPCVARRLHESTCKTRIPTGKGMDQYFHPRWQGDKVVGPRRWLLGSSRSGRAGLHDRSPWSKVRVQMWRYDWERIRRPPDDSQQDCMLQSRDRMCHIWSRSKTCRNDYSTTWTWRCKEC